MTTTPAVDDTTPDAPDVDGAPPAPPIPPGALEAERARAKFGDSVGRFPRNMPDRLLALESQALACLQAYESAQCVLEDATELHASAEAVLAERRAAVLERLVSGGVAATPAEKASKLDPEVVGLGKDVDALATAKRRADTRLSIARNRLAVARDLFQAAAGIAGGAR